MTQGSPGYSDKGQFDPAPGPAGEEQRRPSDFQVTPSPDELLASGGVLLYDRDTPFAPFGTGRLVPSEAPRYEYIRLPFDSGDLAPMNRFGGEGWRVVGVVPMAHYYGNYCALLERQIPMISKPPEDPGGPQ